MVGIASSAAAPAARWRNSRRRRVMMFPRNDACALNLAADRSRRECVGTLLRPEVRGAHDLAPLLGLIRNELAEFGGRRRCQLGPQIGEPRLELGIGQRRVDLAVELAD